MGTLISKVLNDADVRNSMIMKGHAHSAKFSEKNVAVELMDIYSDLVNKDSV
jgi:hypothetical protein